MSFPSFDLAIHQSFSWKSGISFQSESTGIRFSSIIHIPSVCWFQESPELLLLYNIFYLTYAFTSHFIVMDKNKNLSSYSFRKWDSSIQPKYIKSVKRWKKTKRNLRMLLLTYEGDFSNLISFITKKCANAHF